MNPCPLTPLGTRTRGVLFSQPNVLESYNLTRNRVGSQQVGKEHHA